jgi:hypothetical protein
MSICDKIFDQSPISWCVKFLHDWVNSLNTQNSILFILKFGWKDDQHALIEINFFSKP